MDKEALGPEYKETNNENGVIRSQLFDKSGNKMTKKQKQNNSSILPQISV
uniref:Uncharacterized protein n=1 Tax=Anguilla anguilla TaxID=7936 RepID=A0A0E9QPJ2_ANGAN